MSQRHVVGKSQCPVTDTLISGQSAETVATINVGRVPEENLQVSLVLTDSSDWISPSVSNVDAFVPSLRQYYPYTATASLYYSGHGSSRQRVRRAYI